MAKRMRAKLREIKEQLMAIRHEGTERQGRWLCQVLRGWMAYYAVPMSGSAISAFRHHMIERWHGALMRRSQRRRLTWMYLLLFSYARIGCKVHSRGRNVIQRTGHGRRTNRGNRQLARQTTMPFHARSKPSRECQFSSGGRRRPAVEPPRVRSRKQNER